MDPYLAKYLRGLPGIDPGFVDAVAGAAAPAGMPSIPEPQISAGVVRNDRGQIKARETQAGVIRSLEDDYQARFTPIEDDLVRRTMDGADLDQDLDRGRGAVRAAAQNVRSQQRRALARFGVARQADPDRSNDTVSNAVQVARDTRMRAGDRKLGVLGGATATAATAKNEFGGS